MVDVQRISTIAKCFVWLAALLAPAQATFAMSQLCEHCRPHLSHPHEHRCDAHCRHHQEGGDHSPGDSHCSCRRTSQPQQPSAPSFQVGADLAVQWGVVDSSAGALTPRPQRAGVALAERRDRPLDVSAQLCRFRL